MCSLYICVSYLSNFMWEKIFFNQDSLVFTAEKFSKQTKENDQKYVKVPKIFKVQTFF